MTARIKKQPSVAALKKSFYTDRVAPEKLVASPMSPRCHLLHRDAGDFWLPALHGPPGSV